MNPFKLYWCRLPAEKKQKLALDLDTSYDYLSQIANGDRNPSHKFARRIKEHTGLSLRKLRPDIYDEVQA